MDKETFNPKIIILGAGIGGIGMAIKLQRAGFTNLTIIERGDHIGGTWWWNQYPGLAIDIASSVYTFSLEPNPDWSSEFAPREEIQKYIERCAKHHDVAKYIRFNTELIKAVFNEQSLIWELHMKDGNIENCDIFISAPGPIVEHKYPDIKGIEDFKKEKLHSSHWDHQYDFTGKKVAIIGTGASAVQIIPSLTPVVEHLMVFQRRAPWILPKKNFKHGAIRKALYRYLPFTIKLKRFYDLLYLDLYLLLAIADRRQAGWIGSLARKHLEWVVRSYRNKHIKDPVLNKKATPDYPFACKRMCWSDQYYQALTQKNVDLITDHIDHINEEGIVTDSKHLFKADAIVFATGYDVGQHNFEYYGKQGITLSQYFDNVHGANAYLSCTVPNFPNLFLVFGPRGQAGANTLGSIEAGQDYILKLIQYMRKNEIACIEVKESVNAKYNQMIDDRTEVSVPILQACNSYYVNRYAKVGAFGGTMLEFKKLTASVNPDSYNCIKIYTQVKKAC